MTYAEKKKAEAAKLEDDYAAPAGFAADPAHALTEDEKYVIENKGTEAARTGKYDKFYPTTGYFACRKCGAPIYSFQAKFDSGCGWPAFDKCYEGSITAKAEDDGTNRIEIVCAGCNGHLGHVFKGEGFTETGERHCARGMSRVALRSELGSSSSGAGLLGRTPWASARLEWAGARPSRGYVFTTRRQLAVAAVRQGQGGQGGGQAQRVIDTASRRRGRREPERPSHHYLRHCRLSIVAVGRETACTSPLYQMHDHGRKINPWGVKCVS